MRRLGSHIELEGGPPGRCSTDCRPIRTHRVWDKAKARVARIATALGGRAEPSSFEDRRLDDRIDRRPIPSSQEATRYIDHDVGLPERLVLARDVERGVRQ